MKKPTGILLALLCATAALTARADYQSQVLSQNPIGYWRLNETAPAPPGDIATNRGTLGAATPGYYLGTVSKGFPGALVGSADAAAWFDTMDQSFVGVPISTNFMPNGPFTVEFWTQPNTQRPDDAGLISPAGSLYRFTTAPANNANGWIFYQANTGWQFRMGSSSGYKVQLTGTTDPMPGTIYHLVAVYDGSNATLYVNGVQEATGTLSGPYEPNVTVPMGIGARGDNAFRYDGMVDEFAIYPGMLTPAQIQSHYQNGTSTSPATPYDQLVLTGNPLLYYRLNEAPYTPPASLPTAANLGTAGSAADGSYNPGVQTGAPGVGLAGFGVGNLSPKFNGIVGHVSTPSSLNDLAKFTVMGWIKRGTAHSGRGGYFGQNDLLEFGDAAGGASIEAWINAYGANIIIPYPFIDNEWGFIALVGDGTQVVVYTNGVPAATKAGTTASYGSSIYPFNIGGGGVFNTSGDVFLGNVDEVALFDKALTAQQVEELYAAAGVPPRLAQQPAPPDRVLYENGSFTLTATAAGTAPLYYQWLKAGAPIAGKTSADLVFSSLKLTDSGNYSLVVSNAYGAVTSSIVTLSIQPADTTAPTILYATAKRAFNGVTVWFSEPLDPATAQNPANYSIPGLTVTAATLSAPAGSPGDNIVNLTTSAQTAGQLYTLTVTGVRDQATPGNPVAAGTSKQFSAWTLASGYLRFEHYDNLPGASDLDIENALSDPRVVAGTPTTEGLISGRFDSRTIFPDDSHETYLARITGWITPDQDGEYYFFLRSDDASRLYLSANEQLPNPAIDYPIASENDCCDPFSEPDAGDPATTAIPILLEAGKRYGVLALLKEGGGGDNLMVAWRKSTDTNSPANLLPAIPGRYLSTYVDPNIDLQIVAQPTDQPGVLPSAGMEIFARDFNANDGGFTVTNTTPPPPGPWVYDAAKGVWAADGSDSGCTGPYNSQLNSPSYKFTQDGVVTLSFSHRYSFEPDLWDAGQVRVSVNGGPFTLVPAENFTANGYAPGLIVGTGIAKDQRAFNGDSQGYSTGQYIASRATLGTFSKDDTLVVQFAGVWDDCSGASSPSWVIDSMKLEILPMIIQDFGKNNGGFTVTNTTPPPPGPWIYDSTAGQWVANGGDSECTGPYNSVLNSPAYVVPQADEVTLSFSHRYSFEADLWDGGQLRMSVNGGPFNTVPAESFAANGYAPGVIQGTGILLGQRAFNGDSAGYSTNGLITSSAILGKFNQNDTIGLQFAGAWDDCSTASVPGWVIKNLQLAVGTAAKASTFGIDVVATKQGQPVTVTYQWQRDDGAGYVDIPNANAPTYTLYPTAADLAAKFRVVISVPGKNVISGEVKLVEPSAQAPQIGIQHSNGVITITFTGKLQSAMTPDGQYQDVSGATSPYVAPTPTSGSRFFRSAK